MIRLFLMLIGAIKLFRTTILAEETDMNWQCPVLNELCAADSRGCGYYRKYPYVNCALGFPKRKKLLSFNFLNKKEKKRMRKHAVVKREY